MSRGRRPRGLDPSDRALWNAITKSIRPLRRPAPDPAFREADREQSGPSDPLPASAPSRSSRGAKSPPPLARLDRRTRSRISRGRTEIDGRLDLHGLTLERALAQLSKFLASSQARGASIVLVITGKSGSLRREVPHWLSLPELRTIVIGFEEAAPPHGGAGALYVRIRRARP